MGVLVSASLFVLPLPLLLPLLSFIHADAPIRRVMLRAAVRSSLDQGLKVFLSMLHFPFRIVGHIHDNYIPRSIELNTSAAIMAENDRKNAEQQVKL